LNPDPFAIKLRLTKAQISVIWPGLDHIIRADLTRKVSGQALTSYPFQIQPLPMGFDSGTFSPSMMKRIERLWIKLKPIASKGGRIRMDAFELRAAALSVRVTLKLQRLKAQKTLHGEADAKGQFSLDRTTIKELKVRTERVIRSLERNMKRANRQFLTQVSTDEFKALSKEWQLHLRWIRFSLAYFKPFCAFGPGRRRLQRVEIDQLVQMARQAIMDQGFEPPDPGEIRKAIRLFVRYSRRGRQGAKHFRYMLKNRDSSLALSELFEFLEPRLGLGDDVKKRGGKASRVAHQQAASKPEVKALIKKMEKNWKRWTPEERKEHLSTLISKDCTIRGLADDLGMSESTLRQYSTPWTLRVEGKVPPKEVPAPKQAVRKAVSNRLPERPDRHPLKDGASESRVNELVQIALDFIQGEYAMPETSPAPTHIQSVLTDAELRLRDFVWPRPSPVKLLPGASTQEIFRMAKPVETLGENLIEYRGKWLATILVSMTPDPAIGVRAIRQAKPYAAELEETAKQLKEATERELKPHLRRLRDWAKNHPR
jgi:hypothetical protein